MALVLYPNTDWDSYVSIADADALLVKYVLDNAAWTALTDAHKEFYLIQAGNLIRFRITDPLEASTPLDLQIASVILANYSIGKDMTNSDGKDNIKILDITGTLKKEYFSKGKTSNAFPDYVSTLLSQYGFVSQSTLVLDRA